MSQAPLGDSGVADVAAAFEATIDAETPSRSKRAREEREDPKTSLEDLFPNRQMDRSEREGGADEDEPELVRRARRQAREDLRQSENDESEGPRDPIEGDDEDEDDDDPDATQAEAPEDEEDEERAQVPLDLDQVVEVTVDGKPVEVTLNEALKGYIRTETFHQRLGELQNGVQALHGQRQELVAIQQQFVERAQQLGAYVAAFMPQEPDWDALYAQNPTLAAQQDRKWRTFTQQVQNLISARATTQQELAASHNRDLHNFVAANRAHLASSHPEWKSEKTWKRDHDSMRRTARAEGYTDAEIDQLYDARGVNILLKASKWDRLMATKPKPAKSGFGPPSKRNGATPQRNVSRSFERAEKRLSRTGSIQAAADVFEAILDSESSHGKGR